MDIRTFSFRLFWLFLVVLSLFSFIQAQSKNNALTKDIELRASLWTKDDGFLKQLTSNDLEIFSDNKKLAILSAEPNDDPITVGILIDMSGSFHEGDKRYSAILNGLEKFLQLSNPENRYFILGFAEEQKLLLDTTSDKNAVTSALKKLSDERSKNETATWDAIKSGIEKLSNGANSRKAILVLSDGEENVSKTDFNDIKKIVQLSGIQVFQILPQLKDPGYMSSEILKGLAFSEEISTSSSGMIFFPESTLETETAFQKVADELRSQYLIKARIIVDSDEPDWHKLKWKVSPDIKKKFGKITITAPNDIFL